MPITHLTNYILGLQEFIGNMQIIYGRLAKVLKIMIAVTKRVRRRYYTFISLDLVPPSLPQLLLLMFGVSFLLVSSI
jgi:hypothetical protein